MEVDRLMNKLGKKFYVSDKKIWDFGGENFERMMIEKEKGKEIVGNERGDILKG